MTLAFTDSDDKFTDEDGSDFCAASMSHEQLQAKIQRQVKFLNSLTYAELRAALGEDCEEEMDMDEEYDEDELEEGEILQPRTKTTSVWTGGPKNAGK